MRVMGVIVYDPPLTAVSTLAAGLERTKDNVAPCCDRRCVPMSKLLERGRVACLGFPGRTATVEHVSLYHSCCQQASCNDMPPGISCTGVLIHRSDRRAHCPILGLRRAERTAPYPGVFSANSAVHQDSDASCARCQSGASKTHFVGAKHFGGEGALCPECERAIGVNRAFASKMLRPYAAHKRGQIGFDNRSRMHPVGPCVLPRDSPPCYNASARTG